MQLLQSILALSALQQTPFALASPSLFTIVLMLVFDHQGEVRDVPRFCLFYICFGLQLIALVLSAVADVPPEAAEHVKKVLTVKAAMLFVLFSSFCFHVML